MREIAKGAKHWIWLMLFTDVVFLFVTWIIRREALKYMSLFLILTTLVIILAGVGMEYRRQRKVQEAFWRFLEAPAEGTREELIGWLGNREAMESLCERLLGQAAQISEKTAELSEYREYIEAWVHEAKTPLSLSTLVLENHREEISPYVYGRMHYIQHQLNEDVERILYYARLNAEHADYKFTRFRLDECLEEVFEEYAYFLEEKNILAEKELLPLLVVSDRKVVVFLLSQLVSNAVKYADSRAGRILFTIEQQEDQIRLGIHNNGEGVPAEDLPFLFDRGFTGNHPNRQKATGMGLYLVKKYAEKLCITVNLVPAYFSGGFGIELVFSL